jgi:hypothetical protein
VLSAIASVAALTIWGADRLRSTDNRRVWGADLGEWVGRLDAPDAYARDSAITAVADLVSLRWTDLRRSSHEVSLAERRALLAAVATLAWRIGDADSLLREHAATAILELTDEPEGLSHDLQRPQGNVASREPLREVVRDVASSVLRRSVDRPPRPDVSWSVLEVLAAIDAPRETLPLITHMAATHQSPTVRAMAIVVATRSAARYGEPQRVKELMLNARCDTSADVRAVATDIAAGPPLVCQHPLPATNP